MNIYCFSTLSFAKLQFKSVINKAFHKHGVASFTDAWIETCYRESYWQAKNVASFTDAWIETDPNSWWNGGIMSHLLQMRGLKLSFKDVVVTRQGRIFYRCVDWNFWKSLTWQKRKVASFTDAWIETYICSVKQQLNFVASFTDAWIETLIW